MDVVNKKKKRKKIIIAIIIVIIIAIIASTIFFKNKPTTDTTQTITRTVTLEKQDFKNSISADGKVASQSSTNVTTSLTYTVASVNVEVGDYVQVGDTIVTLDTSDLNKKIEREQESIAEKQEELEKDVQNKLDAKEEAWHNYVEADKSYEMGRRFASADGNYQEALEALEKGSSTDTLEDYYEELADCTIKAESAGTITSLNATVGSSVNNTTIATISDVNNLEVAVSVDEYDIQDIEKGMKAIVNSDAVDSEFNATVSAVSLAANTSTNLTSSSFEVKVTLDEPTDQLLIGMNVKVSIILDEENDVYMVPIDSVETDDNGNSVIYVQQENGNFESVSVTTGKSNDYYIIIYGDSLSDGLKVRASANESESQISSDNVDFSNMQGGDISFDIGAGPGGGSMPNGGGPGGQ